MIIGFDFFGSDENTVWDTQVPKTMLDELRLNEGTYDLLHVDLRHFNINDTTRSTHANWSFHTVMIAQFLGNLDAGSMSANGFDILNVQLYRSVRDSEVWNKIDTFPFDIENNWYETIDRYPANGTEYIYEFRPQAYEIIGNGLRSDYVLSDFEGIFVTDREKNLKIEYNLELGEIMVNQNFSIDQPLNRQFPMTTYGNNKSRSGIISFLPLTPQTLAIPGRIDKVAEKNLRDTWVDLLSNGQAKVLRTDDGDNMLISTHGVTILPELVLYNLRNISFEYAESDDLTFESMVENNLLPEAFGQRFTWDDNGNVIVER